MFPFRVFRRHRLVLGSDEQIEFYPSYGYRTDVGSQWRLVIQGCVYNPKLPWFRRRPVMAMIRRAMHVDRGADEFFRRRMNRFLLDAPKGRGITVKIDGQTYESGVSGPAGLFRQEIDVSEKTVDCVVTPAEPQAPVRWLPFQAALATGDTRQFTGRLQLIEANGVSIVSDVDDTIKDSNVPNRRDLFHNTFSRKFRPINGMSALYRECSAQGAVFHFVSGSPWQLYEPLSEFLREHSFPDGAFHLKPFRIRDTARKIRGPQPQLAHKLTVLQPLLAAFPQRRFVLIGDSGEQDPLIYGGLLRSRPEQVAGVFIRAVRKETRDDARLQAAFADCPADRWRLYQAPEEIHDAVLQLVSQSERGGA